MAETVKAVVQKVVRDGKHPYVVAIPEQGGESITITLEKRVWRESEDPNPGEIVLLSKIRKNRRGWRAMRGRFLQPSDEQPAKEQ